MVLCVLKIPSKLEIDTKTWESSVKTYAKNYIKSYFRSFKRHSPEILRIKKLEDYLKSYIKINNKNNNIDIYKIILYIINNIYINNNILYLKENLIYNKKLQNIYRLLTYGNLDVPGDKIINKALNWALNHTARKKIRRYGY